VKNSFKSSYEERFVELKQIKELMTSMKREGMKKIIIKEKTGFELHLERQDDNTPAPSAPVFAHPAHVHHPIHHPVHPSMPTKEVEHYAPRPQTSAPVEEEKGGVYVTSPMVGTFYASSSPDDPAFVKVGDRVEENTVVCIIEAMKVMNEVKAGASGVIAEIYVQNAHPVEFGTKIIRIV
jgi:acetyl-CoA carboxylase biotin carboxyl carrier protein